MDWKTREGGCRCGKVRFRVEAAPILTMACHCRGCQRMTASAFSLSAIVPAIAFSLMQGETVLGALRGEHQHHYCPDCLSWMFTRPQGFDHIVNVRTPLLDDPAGLEPFVDTMTSEKMPWAMTPAVEGFAEFPAPEDFPRLIEAYAARSLSGS